MVRRKASSICSCATCRVCLAELAQFEGDLHVTYIREQRALSKTIELEAGRASSD
jgi:hypothetical protein